METSLEAFLNVLKRSRLVEEGALTDCLEQLPEGENAGAQALADWLTSRQMLTPWQAAKLLQGKHKGFFLGRYKLLKLLGKGGMSSVYLAEHVVMRRRCAIKVLPWKLVKDSSYLQRFHREAQAVAALDHPNIVRAYDVDHEVDGSLQIHFLVMEYVEGKNLYELVQNLGPLPPGAAAYYIWQAAQGLAHAHAAGMVHRDIKPGNFIVDRQGTVKLMDLGLARFLQEESEDSSLTVQHEERVLGTADYLAPEQAIDSHLVDKRADLYSLGCTLYYLLAGRPPFHEGSLTQRLLAHQTQEPTPLLSLRSDLPESLVAIVAAMMVKNREERVQSAEEVAEMLAAWLRTESEGGPEAAIAAATAVAVADSRSRLSGEEWESDILQIRDARAGQGTARPLPSLDGQETIIARSRQPSTLKTKSSPPPPSDVDMTPEPESVDASHQTIAAEAESISTTDEPQDLRQAPSPWRRRFWTLFWLIVLGAAAAGATLFWMQKSSASSIRDGQETVMFPRTPSSDSPARSLRSACG